MNSYFLPFLICLLWSIVLPALPAQEAKYVDFETGEFHASIPRGKEATFGRITNRPHADKALEPMSIGNFWVYESKSLADPADVSRYVVRITGKEKQADGEWFVYNIDIDEEPSFFQRVDGKAIKLKQVDDKEVLEWLRLQPQQGESYGTIDDKLTITSMERIVKTAVGEFKCIELTHESRIEISGEPKDSGVGEVDEEQPAEAAAGKRWTKNIYWYYPGIGIVAIESEDSLDLLIGFNVSN